MKHPLGGDWLKPSHLKKGQRWKYPFYVLNFAVFLLILGIVGLVLLPVSLIKDR